MKKILILQMRPEDATADGEYEAFLKVGGIDSDEVQRIRVEQLERPDLYHVDLEQYSAIIAGGSPYDVSCPQDQKSEKQLQIESFFNNLFEQIIARDFPFLGACSGNGLLGSYCGSVISTRYGETVGTVTVSVTEAGKKDDLLIGLPDQFTAFVGHKEACDDVPENAVLLASSETCPVQMFRIKNNIYATQFHPEADIDQFTLRINIYKHYGYFPPETAEELIAALEGKTSPVTKEILRRFVSKYHSTLNTG